MNGLILKKACSGMFSDELDKMGFRDQVVSGYATNNPGSRVFGPVRTVKILSLETDDENIRTGLSFLENLSAGEILCVEASRDFAYFGELMTRLSLRQRLGGVVIAGLTRDSFFTRTVRKLTIYAEGYSPKDIKGRGRVEACDVPVTVAGRAVAPGDWIFADNDGIVIIPGASKDELERRVLKIIAEEKHIVGLINRRRPVSEILGQHKAF